MLTCENAARGPIANGFGKGTPEDQDVTAELGVWLAIMSCTGAGPLVIYPKGSPSDVGAP